MSLTTGSYCSGSNPSLEACGKVASELGLVGGVLPGTPVSSYLRQLKLTG